MKTGECGTCRRDIPVKFLVQDNADKKICVECLDRIFKKALDAEKNIKKRYDKFTN